MANPLVSPLGLVLRDVLSAPIFEAAQQLLPGAFIDFNPVGGGGILGTSTFTRSTIGYFFDGTGYVQAAIDAARFQTFASVPRHFLREPVAENKVFTQDISDASWSKQQLGITNDGAGSFGFDQWILDDQTDVGVQHRMFTNQTAAINSTTYHIVKDVDRRFVIIRGQTAARYAVFDLQLGTVTEEAANLVTNIFNVGGGWYIISMNDTTNIFNPTVLNLSDTGTPGTGDYTYTGSNKTIRWAHAQVEETPYYTSPVRTSGGALTRTADSLTDAAWPVTSSAIANVTVPIAMPSGEQMNMLGFGAAAASVLTVDGASSARLVNSGIDASITPGSSYENERHGFGMSLVTNEGILVDDEDNDNTDVTGIPGQGTIYLGSASDLTGMPCWVHRIQVSDQLQTVDELKALV